MLGIFIYLFIGTVAGFMAGLLGVGGGLIVVPGLLFAFVELGLTDEISLHLALGTSLASIIFTSLASMRTHHQYGYVKWSIVKRIALGVMIGTFLGAQVVSFLPSRPLQWIFILFLLTVAIQTLSDWQPKSHRSLPKPAILMTVGGGIGFFSSFIGIGGAALSIPFMRTCRVPEREIIGTSSAISFFIAISGALGNMVSGAAHTDLPEWSIGFIYLPALLLIILTSMPMAIVGAKVAHRLPTIVLKKIFAILLVCIAIRIMYSY